MLDQGQVESSDEAYFAKEELRFAHYVKQGTGPVKELLVTTAQKYEVALRCRKDTLQHL